MNVRIEIERFEAPTTDAIDTLVHEGMHDPNMYGPGHFSRMSLIVQTVNTPPNVTPAYTQYVDFLTRVTDQNGVSLWQKMQTWVGPRPEPPLTPTN